MIKNYDEYSYNFLQFVAYTVSRGCTQHNRTSCTILELKVLHSRGMLKADERNLTFFLLFCYYPNSIFMQIYSLKCLPLLPQPTHDGFFYMFVILRFAFYVSPQWVCSHKQEFKVFMVLMEGDQLEKWDKFELLKFFIYQNQ